MSGFNRNGQKATLNLNSGLSCSQSVLLAFCPDVIKCAVEIIEEIISS